MFKLALSAALALPLAAGPINYLTNGDFETGATSGVLNTQFNGAPYFYTIYVFGVGGSTNLGGWTVSNGPNSNGGSTPLSLVVTANPPQVPAGGTYAVDFDPFWNISNGNLLSSAIGTLPELSQTVTLAAGAYVLSFDGAIEIGATPKSRSLGVTLTGAASLSATATTSSPDASGYDLFTYAFTSTGGPVTLTFIPDDFSPAPNFMLDNVSITAAPEPSSLLPLALAFNSLRRRKRRP